MKPKYWARACRELSAVDPTLSALIASYRGEFLTSRGEPFSTLLRSIVGQQISVKAAQSVWDRLLGLMSAATPEAILRLNHEQLRSAGLSSRKAEYSKDLAVKFSQGVLDPSTWPELTDEQVIDQLVRVRGIGRWTAEMFLIFYLLRPNVFPRDDLGLHKAISQLYRRRYPLTERQLDHFAKKFAPWGTVATWYLWRHLDPIPVEY